MISMTRDEMRDWVKRSIKRRYRSISQYAYYRSVDAARIRAALKSGKLPTWMKREFGIREESVFIVQKNAE
jgi:hypothetical protein